MIEDCESGIWHIARMKNERGRYNLARLRIPNSNVPTA